MTLAVCGLVADIRRRGIELRAVGEKLRWRPRTAFTAAELEALVSRKSEVLILLATTCPLCSGSLDCKQRCWHCCDRICIDCGRPTGTAFIQRCFPCGHRYNGNRGDEAPPNFEHGDQAGRASTTTMPR